MRPRDLIRTAGAATAALLLAAVSPTGAASPAVAAPAGGLAFVPSASIDTASIKAHTPAGCPAPADSYDAVVHGHGFPTDGQVVTTPTAAGMSQTEGFDVYFAQTMKDFATDNGTTLKGRYDVSVFCLDSFLGTKFAEYTGTLTFTTPTKYKASGPETTAATTTPATAPPTAVTPAPAPAETGPAETGPAETGPADAVPGTQVVSAPDSTPGHRLPIGRLAAGIAAVLLAFEIGRRFGRRSATARP
jgi:hypothetical protein